MSAGIRPGAPFILPGVAPGGLVLRIYTLSGLLVYTTRLTTDADVRADAELAATATRATRGGQSVCVVVYDGDTGRRWGPLDWLSAGFVSGERYEAG